MPLRATIINTWLPRSSPLEKLATCSSACQRAPCQSICWSAPPPWRYLSGFLNFLLRVHFKDTAFETPKNFICQVFKVCSLFYLTSSPFCPAGQLMMARLPLMKSFCTSTMMNADWGRTIWQVVKQFYIEWDHWYAKKRLLSNISLFAQYYAAIGKIPDLYTPWGPPLPKNLMELIL